MIIKQKKKMKIIKELLKLVITTLLTPIMMFCLFVIVFIGIHEGIWNYKKRESDSK